MRTISIAHTMGTSFQGMAGDSEIFLSFKLIRSVMTMVTFFFNKEIYHPWTCSALIAVSA